MTTPSDAKPSSLSSLSLGKLRNFGRPRLAAILERWGATSVSEYSSQLWVRPSGSSVEPALLESMAAQLARQGLCPSDLQASLEAFLRAPVLQTSTHLCLSEGPTFLAVHLMATTGQPASLPYFVAAYSGVPFSNPAWSGCLNLSRRRPLDELLAAGSPSFRDQQRGETNRHRDGAGSDPERRVSLVPAVSRDGLVYGSRVSTKARNTATDLCPSLKDLLGRVEEGQAFGPWALAASEKVLRRITARQNIFYMDLNALVTDYLLRVFEDPAHPMSRMLFDSSVRRKLQDGLGQKPAWFVAGVQKGKRFRVEPLFLDDEGLHGSGVDVALTPRAISAALSDGKICPGLVPCFLSLVFINGVYCLGSFEQVEYLDRFRSVLAKLGWPHRDVSAVAVDGLTTGRCVDSRDGVPVWPLDLWLGYDWRASPDQPLAQWLEGLASRLLKARR